MRNIVFALVITLGASTALYLLAIAFGLPPEIAKGLAGLPAFAIKNVYEFLEVKSAKLAIDEVEFGTIVDFENFLLSPRLSVAIGLVMFGSIVIITSAMTAFLTSLAAYLANVTLDNHSLLFGQLVIFNTLPLKIIASIYVGRWIGGRSRRYGVVIAIASVIFGGLAAFAVAMLLMDEQMFMTMYGDTRNSHTLFFAMLLLIPDLVVYAIVCSVGAISGRRTRLSRYMSFILKVLTPPTRQAIVDLAHGEAAQLARSQSKPAPDPSLSTDLMYPRRRQIR